MATDKEVLLMNSFDVFMKDYDSNYKNISKLITKMVSLNLELALELWKSVLMSHPETYRSQENWDSSYVTTDILNGVERQKDDNYDTCVDILKSEELIRLATFRYSADLGFPLEYILWRATCRSEYEFVYEALEMINNNTSGEESVSDFIVNLIDSFEDGYLIIEDSDEWRSKTVEFILSLTSFLAKEEDKARVTVALIEYM